MLFTNYRSAMCISLLGLMLFRSLSTSFGDEQVGHSQTIVDDGISANVIEEIKKIGAQPHRSVSIKRRESGYEVTLVRMPEVVVPLLCRLQPMDDLDLSECMWSREAFAELSASAPSLRKLCFDQCKLCDQHLEVVAGFERLESLRIMGGSITGDGVATLSGLNRLESLYLSSLTELNVGDYGFLANKKHLRSLVLHNIRFSDSDLEHLMDLEHLRMLILSETTLTDMCLDRLGEIAKGRELEILDVKDTLISKVASDRIIKEWGSKKLTVIAN